MSELPVVQAGSLLVATPSLRDPNFRRTVIVILMHDEDGSLGLVLNRLSDTATATILPTWTDLATEPRVVYVGGPVSDDSALAFGVLRPEVDEVETPAWKRVSGNAVLVNLESDPDDVADQLRGLRIYVGHAGWGEGQLADEIAEGAWWVVPGLSSDLLAEANTDLWFSVLRRQPLPLAFQAYHPGDLDRN